MRGQIIIYLAVQAVADADLQGLEAVQNVDSGREMARVPKSARVRVSGNPPVPAASSDVRVPAKPPDRSPREVA